MVFLNQDQGVHIRNGVKDSGIKTQKILKTQTWNQTEVTFQGKWAHMEYDKNSVYTLTLLENKFPGRVENTAFIEKGKLVQLVYKKVWHC